MDNSDTAKGANGVQKKGVRSRILDPQCATCRQERLVHCRAWIVHVVCVCV